MHYLRTHAGHDGKELRSVHGRQAARTPLPRHPLPRRRGNGVRGKKVKGIS